MDARIDQSAHSLLFVLAQGRQPVSRPDKVLRPLEYNAHALELGGIQPAMPPGHKDLPGARRPDAGHPQQSIKGRCVHIHRKMLQVVHRPVALGVKVGVEIGHLGAEDLPGREAILPHQKIRLVEPVLPQKRRLGIQRGQQAVRYSRDVG